MAFCTSCGAPRTATSFCTSCGAPQIATPARPQGRPTDVRRLLAGNWAAALATALVAVMIAVGASAALVWLADPARTSPDDRLALTAVSAAASVGADGVGSLDEAGGSGELHVSGGVVPLVISLVALGPAAVVFRRLTTGYARVGPALGDALRAALLHAVLMTTLVVVLRGGEGQLVRKLDIDADNHSWGRRSRRPSACPSWWCSSCWLSAAGSVATGSGHARRRCTTGWPRGCPG